MRHLIFGTGPQGLGRAGGELRQRFGALLTGELGEQVEVYPCESYAELLEAMLDGTIALGWLPPALFVEAHAREAAALLACATRWGIRSYRSAVFVRDDSRVDGVSDLRATRIAWVDPDSCSGYLYPHAALLDAGLSPDDDFAEQSFAGSHTAAARAVAAGEADAGATYVHLSPEKDVRKAGWQTVDARFRAVLTSGEVPSDTICGSTRLDDALLTTAREALGRLGTTVESREILEGLFQCIGFEPTGGLPADYEAVARIRAQVRADAGA